MSQFYKRKGEFEHSDGQITNYEMTVSVANDGKPDFVAVRYSQKLDEAHKNELTEGLANKISKDYNMPPENLNWYEKRQDGNFDRVQFKFLDRDTKATGENNSEYSRTVLPKETVENLENKKKHEALMSEWKNTEAPEQGKQEREEEQKRQRDAGREL